VAIKGQEKDCNNCVGGIKKLDEMEAKGAGVGISKAFGAIGG
jgi:hypothetical protein